MANVYLGFRGGLTATVTEEQAESIGAAFARYQETKVDSMIGLPGGKRGRLSDLQTMESERVTEPPTPSIQEAMQQSINEDEDEDSRTLKQKQLKIFRHNKKCIQEGKMNEYIWYFIQGGKLMKTTKEEMTRRMDAISRKRLLAVNGVKNVGEYCGQFTVGLG